MKHDIVYILKNDYTSEELRYSLRSVCRNFPYNKVWFYGGKPSDIEPDEYVEFIQTGINKWQKVNGTIKAICENESISENWWLFNDDFFIMQKVTELEPMYAGTLQQRVKHIQDNRNGIPSSYSMQLNNTARILKAHGHQTLDYALHVPMLINRRKALLTLSEFEGCPMFRSLYGNHHGIGGCKTKDVKIADLYQEPTGREFLLSTKDTSFRDGAVGRYIRAQFPDKCRYEV